MSTTAPIAGLILAGGNARRMGGIEKGLVQLHGQPLIQYVIDRLSPHVDWLAISANRYLDHYAGFNLPVFPDAIRWQDMGPLSGLASLTETLPAHIEYIQIAPCDTPFLPTDLITRLTQTLNSKPNCQAVYPVSSSGPHPSLMQVKRDTLSSLPDYLESGGRKLRVWLESHQAQPVFFDCDQAFINVNDPETLKLLEDQNI